MIEDNPGKKFDLTDPACAYVFGFMQADGHHAAGPGRKGQVSVEIKAQDADLLYAMQEILPWRSSVTYRTRRTNFATTFECARLTMCGLAGRTRLLELGLPVGRKSAIIAPPAEPFSHADYLRGLIDADGSVGFTAAGTPFLSLVTTSQAIADFTCTEILRITRTARSSKPNRRDRAMNIMVVSDPAAALAAWLYEDACIALARKLKIALAVAAWERPVTMRARSAPKRWTAEEDTLLRALSIREAARALGRSEQSVNMRRWRVRNAS